MRKFYTIFILFVFFSGIFIILYSSFKSRDAFSENLIISLSKKLETEITAYFDIHLRNLLKKQFGVPFISTSLSIEFPVLEGKEICAITIRKGTEPVYMTTVDKNGNKSERFYIRSGNSSQEIQSLREITEFIGKRF